MQISHESPLCLLDKSRQYNDYDYCLVHLCEKYPEYLNFFKTSLKQGRHVLLDNSIFELGIAFDRDKFAEFVIDIKPTEYIIPDVLEDSEATMDSFRDWIARHKDLPGKKIGVIQGRTYKELVTCYEYMVHDADKIAISFDYSYYEVIGLGDTRVEQWVDGRRRLLKQLVEDGIIDTHKPHHLLGCALPLEFKDYIRNYGFIETLDTSNPVLHGMYGIKYGPDGLHEKHMVKMADVFEKVPTQENMDIIEFNITKFKDIVYGNP